MATHSSTLAWRIPWTEEPSGLQSMGSHRVGPSGSDLAPTPTHTHTHTHTQLHSLGRHVTLGSSVKHCYPSVIV